MNGRDIPHFTILIQNTPSSLKIEPEISKNYVLEQIFNRALNSEPLPPLISGLNTKSYYFPQLALNGSLVLFQNLISIKSYGGKTWGGIELTTSHLDQEGLKGLK